MAAVGACTGFGGFVPSEQTGNMKGKSKGKGKEAVTLAQATLAQGLCLSLVGRGSVAWGGTAVYKAEGALDCRVEADRALLGGV